MRTHKLNEAEFWKRYFQSKLFNAHRASIRSSATQHVVKDDPIFDKYLEKDDDGKFRPSVAVNEILIRLLQSWSRVISAMSGWISSLTLGQPWRTTER